MSTSRNAVVVAIGSDGSESAVQFAVAEARRTARPVHLIHVLQIPSGEAYAAVYDGALEASRAVLDDALAHAGRIAGSDVSVTGELIDDGWVVEDLVSASTGDSLIVLQHRAFNQAHRLFTGSVVQSVAGKAPVPVVSVPQGWAPGTSGVVVAAVQDPLEAPALLRTAFEEARSRAKALTVLHAWWLASGFDMVVVDDAVRADASQRTLDELAPVLSPLQAEFPDVAVTIDIKHAPPVEAVLDAAQDCDLLVLGRRHHRLPWGGHLGPVARAAISHAAAPVLITPELAVPAKERSEATRPRRAGELAPL